MSGLIFAHAKSIRRQAKKKAEEQACIAENCGNDYNLTYDTYYNQTVSNAKNEFKEILYIAEELHEVYKELHEPTYNHYFITIRPDENKTNFQNFYHKICEYVKRKFFITYKLSFEQKGISEETLGNGFHCHIIACTNHKSKGACLRDTISTFNKYCSPNCIEICTTKNPEELVQTYLIDYISKDNHKETTKEWDSLWREKHNLKHIYSNTDPPIPLSVSSPAQIKELTYNLTWE